MFKKEKLIYGLHCSGHDGIKLFVFWLESSHHSSRGKVPETLRSKAKRGK
jgi:hypothetical protein